MNESNYNLAMLLISILGFAVTIYVLRKDNRKSNVETVEKIIVKTISDVEEKNDIEKRVALLEQKIQFQDYGLRNELKELKETINKWASKIDKHIETHNK